MNVPASGLPTTDRAVAPRRAREVALPLPLDRWQLGRVLQSGPLAELFEARPAGGPPDAAWPYVVKRLHSHWHGEPRAVELLLRGAVVGTQVSHPHLVAVLDARIDGPPYYTVMPRLEGESLRGLLAARRRLELPLALWFARQVAEALAALHAQSWLHCDVKPENVMVAQDGHVTLVDLDFARHFDQSGSAVDRWIAGTFQYIAPEMISSTGRFDGRSDLYSLGAMLYETLAGRTPFLGRDLAELAGEHRRARPPDLDRLVPHLPGGVVELVHHMLAKEPLRRPQSAAEVVSALVALEIETLAQQVADGPVVQ